MSLIGVILPLSRNDIMNLYLEKRPDGTYYFRQTKLVNKKQVVKRISLKTRSAKIAKLLAIQLLAKTLKRLITNNKSC